MFTEPLNLSRQEDPTIYTVFILINYFAPGTPENAYVDWSAHTKFLPLQSLQYATFWLFSKITEDLFEWVHALFYMIYNNVL